MAKGDAEVYRRDIEDLAVAQNSEFSIHQGFPPVGAEIFCPCDEQLCEKFTYDREISYSKALAGKLCSVCPRFEGCKNK